MLETIREIGRLLALAPLDRWAAVKGGETRNDRLLLVRLDSMGDYILFRNFIPLLREAPRYRHCRITLCGNAAWRELAETCDGRYLDDFIWIDRKRFHKDIPYRFGIMGQLAREGFSAVINPTYSREVFYSDAVARGCGAPERIGYAGGGDPIERWAAALGGAPYTRTIATGEGPQFEFIRNRRFFEELLGYPPAVPRTSFDPSGLWRQTFTDSGYAVIFPGAAETFRRWGTENFAAVADHLAARYGLEVLIAGSAADGRLAGEILAQAQCGRCRDITGRTTLSQLVGTIAGAALLVTNDTGAVHIGAAVDTNTVCVSNGKHYGRFVPYPAELGAPVVTVFPPEIAHSRAGVAELARRYQHGSPLDIASVQVATVLEQVDALLRRCPPAGTEA